ncbi:MAG: DUF4136 domain-containing protein [Bacteroidota bacterium]
MRYFILISLILIGCSPRIVSYVNPKAAFENFQTYRLVSAKLESKNVSPQNTSIFDLIKQNIHQEMNKRNYEVSNVSPDLTLRYEITSNTRVEVNNFQDPFLFRPNQINSRTIYESILLLELYDQKKKLVWQGSYDLRQQRKEKKTARAIEKAIGYIFTTYPYKASSSKIVEDLKSIKKD